MIVTYLIIIFIISLVTFLFYFVDKNKASNNSSNRLPEIALITLTSMGGGLGALLALKYIHHKSKKIHFFTVTALSVIVQLLVIPIMLLI